MCDRIHVDIFFLFYTFLNFTSCVRFAYILLIGKKTQSKRELISPLKLVIRRCFHYILVDGK